MPLCALQLYCYEDEEDLQYLNAVNQQLTVMSMVSEMF